MKLIRWVEVHIGRSRRKVKKGESADRDATPPPSTPHRKVEPLPRSAGSTPRKRPPDTPRLHIRTTLIEPEVGSPLASRRENVDSPRVRCRIRTNPWLPSPKNSERWRGGGGVRASSIGSESSESISGFGSQSSGSLWEGFPGESWGGFRSNGRSPSSHRLPRVTLEPRSGLSDPFCDEDTPYCPATYCRPIPRSAWVDFKELLEKTAEDGESSDEAYSEDYVHADHHLSLHVSRASEDSPLDTGSPQADSACGSDPDNSSCSTTPLSETPASSSSRKSLAPEMLQHKVQRLQQERHLVDQRMQAARAEEMVRREEQLMLQRELVQFRRLFLIQTLSELRNQLERKHLRPLEGGEKELLGYDAGLLQHMPPLPKHISRVDLDPRVISSTWLAK